MKKPVRSLALLAAASLTLGMSATGGPAVAAPAPEVLATHLAGPLSLDVADDGSAFVTANFGGQLLHVVPGQDPVVVYTATEKNAEVGGVSVNGQKVIFTVTVRNGSKKVYEIIGGAAPKMLANVGRYEKQNNPDAKTVYGFKGISKACLAKLPKDAPGQYNGIVDSHPYSSESTTSTVYVGDAAGNDILAISPSGVMSTVAVLPPTKVTVTKPRAEALNLPACTVGLKFKLEPVPTDVELGPDGWLYVSSLPGGPEDGSLGPQGRVYKVDPATGQVIRLARGFLSAVDVAVADNGDVYVAELFANQISLIPAGTHDVKPFIQVSMPGSIEWTTGYLYATTDVLKGLPGRAAVGPKGKLVRIPWSSGPYRSDA